MDRIQKHTHESNLIIKGKVFETQETIVDKQLDYFKCRNKITNETQMNMANVITSLGDVMRKISRATKVRSFFFQNKTLMHTTKEMHNKFSTCVEYYRIIQQC